MTATSSFHQQDTSAATARQADLERREQELAARFVITMQEFLYQAHADHIHREAALNERSEHIRKHGRNNFPPCELLFVFSPAACAVTLTQPWLAQFSLSFSILSKMKYRKPTSRL
jgi:hypothetical protein